MSTTLEEFFLKGRKDVVYVETIEVIHPEFTKSLRVVRNVTTGWSAKLNNTDANRVDFIYFPLSIEVGSSKTDLDQSLTITVGDLGEVLPDELNRVLESDKMDVKPIIKMRCYASNDPDTVLFGPITLQIDSFNYNEQGTSFVATAPNLNKARTGEVYSTTRFPFIKSLI